MGRNWMDGDRDRMTIKQLKFKESSMKNAVNAHEDNRIFATTRYDDEKEIERGEELDLANVNGEKFGYGMVGDVIKCDASEAIEKIHSYGAVYNIGKTHELLSELNDCYDDDINAHTQVKILFIEPLRIF